MSTAQLRGPHTDFRSTLTLFVAGIAADNVDHAAPPNELAVFADAFDASAHFHVVDYPILLVDPKRLSISLNTTTVQGPLVDF